MEQYNYWTVISEGKRENNIRYMLCRCKCGEVREIQRNALVHGHSKSCGCYRREAAIIQMTKHGGTHTPTFKSWRAMLGRCNCKQNNGYPTYGGIGITVQDSWYSFVNFRNDMGERPPGTELDRIDPNKGYTKENCRWVTHRENLRNRITTLVYKGRKLFKYEIAKEMNISLAVLNRRLKDHPNLDLETIAFL